MTKIYKIVAKTKHYQADGTEYFRTHVILDDGTEATGWGKDYEVGDRVGYWFDEQYNVIKMRRYPLTSAGKSTRIEKDKD